MCKIFSFFAFLVDSNISSKLTEAHHLEASATPPSNRRGVPHSWASTCWRDSARLAGSLTLLVAAIQFTAPHAFLSTATGLAFSARAIGGTFGSAVLNAIINGRLIGHHAAGVGAAAISAGLLEDSVPELLEALDAGTIGSGVVFATPAIWDAAVEASRWEYAYAYRLAWASVIPFVVLAIVAVALLKGVKDLMTEKVEATVEHVPAQE